MSAPEPVPSPELAGPAPNGSAEPLDPVAALVAELEAAPAAERPALWEARRGDLARAMAGRGAVARKAAARRFAELLEVAPADVLRDLDAAAPPVELVKSVAEPARPSLVLPPASRLLLERIEREPVSWLVLRDELAEVLATIETPSERRAFVKEVCGTLGLELATALEELGLGPSSRQRPEEWDLEGNAVEDQKRASVRAVLAEIVTDGLRSGAMRLIRWRGEPFVDLIVDGRRETWPAVSPGTIAWLARQLRDRGHDLPRRDLLRETAEVLATCAAIEGEELPVELRIGAHGNKVHLDLAAADWRVVEIAPGSWQVVDALEIFIRFWRSKSTRPLPEPRRGAGWEALARWADLLGLSAETRVLVFAWLVSVIANPAGPHWALVLVGEHGSGKSTVAAAIRSLVDPRVAPLRALPHDERSMATMAKSSYVIGFDNVTTLPQWMSDHLCMYTTGGGVAQRQLYTDADEYVFEGTRPVLVTAINNPFVAPDLLDRALVVTLGPIHDVQRRPLRDLEAELAALRPAVFGALCDAAALALARLPTMPRVGLGRMADAELVARAAAPAYCDGEEVFRCVYAAARGTVHQDVIEGDPIGRTLVAKFDVLAPDGRLEKSAEDLLELLAREAGVDLAKKPPDWPRTGRGLAARLVRLGPALRRAAGLEIGRGSAGRGREKVRTLIVTRAPARV